MKLRLAIMFLLSPVLCLMVRCSNTKDHIIGLEFLQRDNVGSELHTIFQASSSDTFFQASISTGIGPNLYFGKYGSIQAKTLIRFDTLTINNPVDSLVLNLNKVKIYSQAAGILRIIVSTMKADWNEETASWNNINQGSVGDLILATTITTGDTSLELTLPNEWAVPLVHSTKRTAPYGIVIEADPADGLAQTTSRESQPIAQLKIYINKQPVSVNAVQDAFIAQSSIAPETDRLYTVNGIALRSLLKFDLSGISKHAIIGRALLTLHVDPSVPFPPIQTQMGVMAYGIRDSLWSPPQVPVDSSKAVGATTGETTVVFNVTMLVQNWVSGYAKNAGLMLAGGYYDPRDLSMAYFETFDLAGLAYFSTRADSANRPSIDMYYTLPASSPY